MTGEELYALFTEGMARQSCGVDEWDDLDPMDQEAWQYVADNLKP